jgi:hypothetical protein
MDLFAELVAMPGLSPEECERVNVPVTRALAREAELAMVNALRADLTLRAAEGVAPNRVAEILRNAIVQWVRHEVEPVEYLKREGGRTAEERAALAPIADRVEREAFSLRLAKLPAQPTRRPTSRHEARAR